ncbi:MAG TPA: GreA/GreB family elongation factor, partial [Gammaproteobacteria bacterium]|nr:GreA/GreB family elongation factor [Gammaproteobacteria bacterium]
ADRDAVRFGATVVLENGDGQRVTYRIVGEDEADPARGKISYVAPLAMSLLGSQVGDVVEFAGGQAEIVEIG